MTLDFFPRTGPLDSRCGKGGRTSHKVCPVHLLIRRFSKVGLLSDRRTCLVSLIRLPVEYYLKIGNAAPRTRRFPVER